MGTTFPVVLDELTLQFEASSQENFYEEEGDEHLSWFSRLLQDINELLERWLSENHLPRFELRFAPNQCRVPCEHAECVSRFLGRARSANPEIWWRNLGHTSWCAKNTGHSGPCLCAVHCPPLIVDLQVYRPWQRQG